MVCILHKATSMKMTKPLYLLLVVPLIVGTVALAMYLRVSKTPEPTTTLPKIDQMTSVAPPPETSNRSHTSIQRSEEIATGSTTGAVSQFSDAGPTKLPRGTAPKSPKGMTPKLPKQTIAKTTPLKTHGRASRVMRSGTKDSPQEPASFVTPESISQPDVSQPRSFVLPRQEDSALRLCGGQPICRCEKVKFTHGDFALLVLGILGLGPTENSEEAFEILDSFRIRPSGGWAEARPEKLMSQREMEEVRCCVSIAYEDGLIRVGPAVLAAGVDRFCEELEYSLAAMEEDTGVVTDRPSTVAEAGHQGGQGQTDSGEDESVASPPF
jgi:hypothetical protein